MKRIVALIAAFSMIICTVHAQIGDSGFETGISSQRLTSVGGKKTTQTYPYSELVLVTGEPLIFSGTVAVTSSLKDDLETYSYKCTLFNGEKNRLTRTCVYNARLSLKGDQCIRTISGNTKPKETISIDGITYTLDTTDSVFSMSTVSELKPACEYYAGNWSNKKTYKTIENKQVTVNLTGKMYGCEQYWGAAEIQEIKAYIVGVSQKNGIYDQWGGGGNIKIKKTTANSLTYIENTPEAISFSGGYLQRQEDSSVLDYSVDLPIFDSQGIALDSLANYSDTFSFTTLTKQERLNVVDTSAIKGYWYEENIRQLAGLGILNEEYLVNYKRLEENMTRKEFAAAISKAAGLELMPLPVQNRKTGYIEKPFSDIDPKDEIYQYIYTLYKKGIMTGTDEKIFSPDLYINRAQAILIIIRMLGLEAAGTDYGITQFKDNDDIPVWAKSAVLTAEKIGIVKGDENNNLNPNTPLSVSAAFTLISNVINYMRDGMLVYYRN